MKIAKTKLDQNLTEILDNNVDGSSILDKTIDGSTKLKEKSVSKKLLSQELQDEINSHPGKKTYEGGEIFNDYDNNEATGKFSHAEGFKTKAYGDISHAEGQETTANGIASHTEGAYTYASGIASHTEGLYTSANSDYQHVEGIYNIRDRSNKYVHIVGNGVDVSDDDRSNAHTLDWDGNAWFAGDIKIGGTEYDSDDAISLLGDKPITVSTDLGKTTADVGGIKSGTDITNMNISELLRNMLLPYKATGLTLKISFKNNQSTEYSNINYALSIPTTNKLIFDQYSYSITPYSNKPTSMTLYINNNNIQTLDITDIDSGGTHISPEYELLLTDITKTIPIKLQCYDGVDSSGKALYSSTSFNITTRPYIYYGNSDKTFTVDSSGNIDTTDILSDLAGYKTGLNYAYDSTASLAYNFPNVTNQYSYVLLPGTKNINTALDKNGFTQNITYIGKTNIKYDTITVPYKLFITGTATATAPKYTFYIV